MISINKYAIQSWISDRYAVTNYLFNFYNTHGQQDGSCELKFSITIDPHSFISGFKANIDGEIFYGETKEKNEAKTEYIAAKEKNENGILITQPDANICNVFEISTNIDAESNISLDITIDQYLTKKFNFNQLTVQILNDFGDNITKDYGNIDYQFVVKDKRGIYDITLGKHLTEDSVINMPNDKNCTIAGKIKQSGLTINELVLKYKIKGEQNESNILFDKNSGIFCHVISDVIVNATIHGNGVEEGGNDGINEDILIPRRVIFVIDKSGSMAGSRWEQATSSTIAAIKQLRVNYDRYSIVLFNNKMEILSKALYVANEENIAKTISYLNKHSAGGGTNINSAMRDAIKILKNDIQLLNEQKNTENNFNFYMNQIILITDGAPNKGVSDTNEIIKNVKNWNELTNIDKYSSKISIFAFGVGSSKNDKTWIQDLNHSFLQILSASNHGIYSRIKSCNIDTQLNQFYNILSKPILTNIKIKYNNKYISHLTKTTFNALYSGNDLIVCGKLNDNNSQLNNIGTFSATITAITGKESSHLTTKPVMIQKKIKLYFDNQNTNKNVEKIWAYLKLQRFAEQKLINDEQKLDGNDIISPLALAMKYKLLSPWTSMIVVQQRNNDDIGPQPHPHYLPTPQQDVKEDIIIDVNGGQFHPNYAPTPAQPIPQKQASELSKAINPRKTGSRRGAPPFSRTLKPSSFTYPATSTARRSRKLIDIEEGTKELHQFMGVTSYDLCSMDSDEVCHFIAALGSVYPSELFGDINGLQLAKFSEEKLKEIGVEHKLHRCKILLAIERCLNKNGEFQKGIKGVLSWDRFEVQQWMEKHSSKLMKVYASNFCHHGVDGILLFDLDEMDLRTIGVMPTDRLDVLRMIEQFREEIFSSQSIASNRRAILDTMVELLVEIGCLFTNDKVQHMTTMLQEQLRQLKEDERRDRV